MNYPKYAEPREFKVATICGSMRFYDRMLKVAEQYTAVGRVVLMPFVTVAADEQGGSDAKVVLDRMHRQKIDMADLVVIVTDPKTKYVGDSTRGEIEYAESRGKPVTWQLVQASGEAEPTSPTKAAIDVIACEVTEQMLDPMDLGDIWSDYPEIGDDDWRDVVARVRDRAEAAKPDVETYKAAYAHLQGRAEAWAAENDPA